MDANEFRKIGQETIEWIADYKENTKNYSVISKAAPGYLALELPGDAPLNGEPFDLIMEEFHRIIMKGVTHWNHPQFHGYFPAGNAYTNIIADALNAAIGSICFSWTSCPAATELETIVLDWMARALDLPEHFMTDKSNFIGGGCFQGSASESTLLATFAARARSIEHLNVNCSEHESVFLPQLVVYSSREAHSSVEKACKMALIRLRILDTDEKGVLHGKTVSAAIKADLAQGLTPCLVVATLGTTGLVTFDDLNSIGEAIKQINAKIPIWLHVDGAYGGNAMICPEFRHLMKGLEMADSFMVNPNKLMLGAFDMTCFWVRDVETFKKSLVIDPAYLHHSYENKRQLDYRHYSVPLSRRFRALKLWFLMRSYGIDGLQKYVRNIVANAEYFKELVEKDPRFEVFTPRLLGLVCFRYKDVRGSNSANIMTNKLVDELFRSQLLYVVPTKFQGKIYCRFSVNFEHTTKKNIDDSWEIIQVIAKTIEPTSKKPARPAPFSFFRSVSKEVYDRQNSHPTLTDGCTPIFVVDTDDIVDSLRKASVKTMHAPLPPNEVDGNNNGSRKF